MTKLPRLCSFVTFAGKVPSTAKQHIPSPLPIEPCSSQSLQESLLTEADPVSLLRVLRENLNFSFIMQFSPLLCQGPLTSGLSLLTSVCPGQAWSGRKTWFFFSGFNLFLCAFIWPDLYTPHPLLQSHGLTHRTLSPVVFCSASLSGSSDLKLLPKKPSPTLVDRSFLFNHSSHHNSHCAHSTRKGNLTMYKKPYAFSCL